MTPSEEALVKHLNESSKSDHNLIVGSDIRMLVSIIQRLDGVVNAAKKLIKPISIVRCHGDKCREANCASCNERKDALDYVKGYNEAIEQILK